MKKTILRALCFALCVPLVLLCGCSNKRKSKLNSIDLGTYFSVSATSKIYDNGITNTKKLETINLTATSPNKDILDKYESFEIKANAEWIYKMYVDYICFYVYTTEDTATEMVVNISLTNAILESEIGKAIDDNTKFETQTSLIPKKDGSIFCEVKIDRVVATATGATLTLDILNSVPQIFTDNEGKENGLKWIIYGLEIYGESRAYSGK